VLPGGEIAVVDRDAGLAGIFTEGGGFISYLEAPKGFHPSSVASGSGLGLYVLDSLSSEIYRYDSRWNLAGLAYSTSETALYAGICFDKTGSVYLSDQETDEIVVIDPSAGTERRLGGFGAERGMLVDPAGVAVDEKGLLYVCDWGNSRMQILDGWGGVVKVWVLKSEECVARPKAVSVDRWGNAFVLDEGCGSLRVLNADGVETVRLEGKGPGLGFLSGPEGLDLDSKRLFVADAVDGEIQIFEIQYATYR
jgi:DNA-binding beta-propeller fold protein YncE